MFEEILIFCTFGILAGLLAGMFGIGGGLIMVPVLIGTFMNLGFNSEIIVQLAIGTSIGCIIFTSILQLLLIIIKALLIYCILSLLQLE